MKQFICTVIGVCGSALCYFLGGWDASLICLFVFMLVDLICGLIVAIVFHKSPKNENGKLESKQFIKGVCKKIAIIALVGVSHLLDIILGVDFIRTAAIFAFIANETISIIENAGLMGIPIPSPIINALELLEGKNNTK